MKPIGQTGTQSYRMIFQTANHDGAARSAGKGGLFLIGGYHDHIEGIPKGLPWHRTGENTTGKIASLMLGETLFLHAVVIALPDYTVFHLFVDNIPGFSSRKTIFARPAAFLYIAHKVQQLRNAAFEKP